MKQMLYLLLVLLLPGCTATMVKNWDDDMNIVGAQKGGSFSYLDQGADFVIEQRKKSGITQAQKYCGEGRPVFFVGEQRSTSTTTGSVPVQQTAHHSGTVGSGLNQSQYNGTSTYTTYAPTTYTWNHNKATFICGDGDIDQSTYAISVPENGAAVCTDIEKAFAPGSKRIEKLASAASSDNCISKEGWVRYLSNDKQKIHLFVGDKGKSTCKKVENEMISQQVSGSNANLWMRKRLTCGSGAIAH